MGNPIGHHLLARVPLDQVFEGAAFQRPRPLLVVLLEQQPHRIEAAVGPRQHRQARRRQFVRPWQHPLQEVVRLQRTVLAAGPQLQRQAPALVAKVRGNRGVAVHALVGAVHAFLLRAAVVHHKGVKVEADKPVHRRDRRFGVPQQADTVGVRLLAQCHRQHLHSLAQPGTRRHSANPHRLPEKAVFPKRLNRFEIAFAQGQQPDITFDDVGRGYLPFRDGELFVEQVQPGRLKALAHQDQAGIGSNVARRLLEFKSGHGAWVNG